MKRLLILAAALATSLTCSAQLYTGAGVGYLLDGKEEYFTARLGWQVGQRGAVSHALEVEVAFISDSDYGITLDLVPLMANYRGTTAVNDKLNVTFGAGVGASFFKAKGWGVTIRDEAFSVQAFAGLEYQLNASVSLVTGLRYLWIDDVWGVEVGDDVGVEAGIRIRF